MLQTVFRIRIHWFRIRIQHFRLNTNLDRSGFRGLMTKNCKKITARKINYFFDQIIAIYFFLWRPSMRSLQPSKENILQFKTWNFLTFYIFVGYFCPPRSGYGFRIPIRIHWPDWIRIQSGSETLIENTRLAFLKFTKCETKRDGWLLRETPRVSVSWNRENVRISAIIYIGIRGLHWGSGWKHDILSTVMWLICNCTFFSELWII